MCCCQLPSALVWSNQPAQQHSHLSVREAATSLQAPAAAVESVHPTPPAAQDTPPTAVLLFLLLVVVGRQMRGMLQQDASLQLLLQRLEHYQQRPCYRGMAAALHDCDCGCAGGAQKHDQSVRRRCCLCRRFHHRCCCHHHHQQHLLLLLLSPGAVPCPPPLPPHAPAPQHSSRSASQTIPAAEALSTPVTPPMLLHAACSWCQQDSS